MQEFGEEQSDGYWQLFVNSVVDYAIIALDADGRVARWNLGAERLKGYTAEEITGRHFSTFYTDSDREAGLPGELLNRARSEGHVEHRGWRRRKDGTLFWGDVVINAMRGDDGTLLGYAKVTRDLTEHKQAQEREHALTVNLDRANRLKSKFLANMSHEIRTPLNGVSAMLTLLLKTDLDSEQRDFAQTAALSSSALLRIVNDILDFSKIEADKLELEVVGFSPTKLLHEVRDLFMPEARDKALQIRLEIDDAIPQRVFGDPGRLRQVLSNLVGNAIKFTTQGEVAISAVGEASGSGTRVRFDVVDTGIGISPEDQARVFDAFSQADASTTRRYGGTGLGLTISQQLVSLMGGTFEIASTPGTGSRFTVVIDFELGADHIDVIDVEAEDPSFDQTAQRVLVVEDNEINQRVLMHFLGKLGYEVDLVVNGLEALTALESGVYAAVLMDCHMPVMDGFEATRHIRSLSSVIASVPIIAVTASALPEERERCFHAGMDDFIAKPVSIDILRQVLDHHLSQNVQQ